MNTQFVNLGRNTELLRGNAGVLFQKCTSCNTRYKAPALEKAKQSMPTIFVHNAEIQGRIAHRSNETHFRTH